MDSTMMRATQLFSKDAKAEYVIPMYQRNYTWEKDNVEQLLFDLEGIIQRDYDEEHHFNTVYLKKQGKGPGKTDVYKIVDGQQRMTTITLILVALSKQAQAQWSTAIKEQDESKIEKFSDIKSEVNGYLYVKDNNGKDKIKVTLSKNDNEALQEILEGDVNGSYNLKNNYQIIENHIHDSPYTVEEYLESLSWLQVARMEMGKGADEQEIFDGLNAKGQALSFGEQLKNFFLLELEPEEQAELYANYWMPIELGLNFDMDKEMKKLVYINFAMVNGGQLNRRTTTYNLVKKHINNKGYDKIEVLKGMYNTINWKRELDSFGYNGDKIKVKIKRLLTFNSQELYVYLIASYKDYKNGVISREEYSKTLTHIEGYYARKVVMGSKALSPDYLLYIHKEGKEGIESGEGYFESIKEVMYMGKQGTKMVMPTDETVRTSVLTTTHSLQKVSRPMVLYLLERVENGNSKEPYPIYENYGKNKPYSIEHIMPKKMTDEWRKSLGGNHAEIHATFLNTLGNLSLTGYNSEYSNKPFREKQNMPNGFRESNFKVLNGYPAIANRWTETEIRERALQLAERVIELYPYK